MEMFVRLKNTLAYSTEVEIATHSHQVQWHWCYYAETNSKFVNENSMDRRNDIKKIQSEWHAAEW